MEPAELCTALLRRAPPRGVATALRSDAWLRFALGVTTTHRVQKTNRAQRARVQEFVKYLDLWCAYRDAAVAWRGRVLHVGDRAPARLVIVTAYNPGSIAQGAARNRAAHARLVAALHARGLAVENATNGVGSRFVEPSVAVFGPLPPLLALAEAFGQRAIYATVRGRFALVARRGPIVSYAG